MASIKKAFQPIIAMLETAAAENKRVSAVIEDVKALCTAKSGGGGGTRNFHKHGDNVVAIKCGYFGKWFDISRFEFGAKASSASGFNSMSKAGTNAWTKQNSEYKKGRESIMTDMLENNLTAEAAQTKLAELEEAKKVVLPIEGDYQGFDTLEECLTDMGLPAPAPADAE